MDTNRIDGLTCNDGDNQTREEQDCLALVLRHDLCWFPAVDRNGFEHAPTRK